LRQGCSFVARNIGRHTKGARNDFTSASGCNFAFSAVAATDFTKGPQRNTLPAGLFAILLSRSKKRSFAFAGLMKSLLILKDGLRR